VILMIKVNHGGLWTLSQIHELRRRGHQVTVVLPPGEGRLRRALDAETLPVVESAFDFSFRPRWSTVRGLAQLRRQLVALAPDVIFYHLYASALAARFAGVGLAPRVHMVAGPLYLESARLRTVERLLAGLDTVTICGSEFTARAYRRLGRLPRDTPVIAYGVDADHFRPRDPGPARAGLGIDPSAFVVVMVAFVYAPKKEVYRGRGIKGHSVLLDAWPAFHTAHPESRLMIVGGGIDHDGERYRTAMMHRHGLPRRSSGITWITTVDDVRPYYAAADLSVSPSLSENHGAALEAGAMGVPSIVSDAGALPETVAPGTGWIVPAGDAEALTAALESAHAQHVLGTLRDMSRATRRSIANHFDVTRCSSAVADVIERAGSPGPATASTVPGRGTARAGYSVFCEARFGRGDHGDWAGTDAVSNWERYGDGVRVVARADTRPGTGEERLPNGVVVVGLPHYVGVRQLLHRVVPLVVSIFRAVREADAIILRLPGVIGSIAALACRVMRRPYAAEVVGDPQEVLATGVLGTVGRRVGATAAAYTRWAVRRADTVLYATKQRLQDRYPPGRGSTATAMANVVLGSGDYSAGPRRWTPGRARIIAVGSQEQHYKGHDVLLRAIRRLVDSGIDVDAVIVGGGRMHHEIQGLATSLRLTERVTLTGAINDRDRLVGLLEGASVFAMPSRTEGLPRALIEGMARALPAVGTAVGGIPELLEPRWVVPPDDDGALAGALADLLTDPDVWEAESRRNVEVAGEYHLDILGRRFATWLDGVPLAGPHRARTARGR